MVVSARWNFCERKHSHFHFHSTAAVGASSKKIETFFWRSRKSSVEFAESTSAGRWNFANCESIKRTTFRGTSRSSSRGRVQPNRPLYTSVAVEPRLLLKFTTQEGFTTTAWLAWESARRCGQIGFQTQFPSCPTWFSSIKPHVLSPTYWYQYPASSTSWHNR